MSSDTILHPIFVFLWSQKYYILIKGFHDRFAQTIWALSFDWSLQRIMTHWWRKHWLAKRKFYDKPHPKSMPASSISLQNLALTLNFGQTYREKPLFNITFGSFLWQYLSTIYILCFNVISLIARLLLDILYNINDIYIQTFYLQCLCWK